MTRKLPADGATDIPSMSGHHLRGMTKRIPAALFWSCLTGLVAFLVYLATLAPDITWSNFGGDGGELITAAVTLGVPHPPGYPTYVLLGKLISFLPVGTVAFRFNLFSAACMATAVAFATATAYRLLAGAGFAWAAAVAAGLALAFSPLAWSQGTVAEVYGLNMAVLAIFLWSLLTRRSPWLSGVMLGLAVTTHLTSLLMVPLGLVLNTRGKRMRFFIALLLGLLPLAALPLLARLNSPVIWGTPTTLQGWWWLVSGQLYAPNLAVLTPEFPFILRLSTWSATVLAQFAWVGWLFVGLGVLTNTISQKLTRWLLLTAAFYTLFSFIYATDDALLNFLPALLLLVPFLASGLARAGYLSLLLPLVLLVANFDAHNLRKQQTLRPAANQALDILPLNAIVVTPGDASIFTLWYFQHVEGRRPDIILVDHNLLAFNWYRERLSTQYPELEGLATDNPALFRRLNQRRHPVCELTLQRPEAIYCVAVSSGTSMRTAEGFGYSRLRKFKGLSRG